MCRRRLILTPIMVLAFLVPALSGAGSPLELRVLGALPGAKVQVLSSTDGLSFEPVEPLQVHVESTATLIELSAAFCGGEEALMVHSESAISRPFRVAAEECGRGPVQVRLYPSARVSGRITVPRKAKLPRVVQLRLGRCPHPAEGQPEGASFPAGVDEKGGWQAPIPAGCWDLNLVARGFAPHTWWGVTVAASASKSLGAVGLVPGASLLVHVADGTDGIAVGGAHVILVPEAGAASAYATLLQGGQVAGVASAGTNERGWARLDGLAAGRYAVLATHEGFAPLEPRIVELSAGEETVLDDLELPRPGVLAVDFELPAASVGALEGMKLNVMAVASIEGLGYMGRAVTVFRPIRPGETVELRGLAPIEWKLSILAQGVGGGGAIIASEKVRVSPGGWQPVSIKPSGTLFRGTVSWRDEPVAARLSLRCRPVEDKRGSFMGSATSTEEGEFAVLLEHPGICAVGVHGTGGALDTTVPHVEFLDPEETVEIRIPEGEISGVVVDEEGRPRPRFRVEAMQMSGWQDEEGRAVAPAPMFARRQTDDAGTFHLTGLAEGAWKVQASEPGLESDPTVIRLQRDATVEGVRLVIHRNMKIEGTLRFDDGTPVANAGFLAFVNTVSAVPMAKPGRTDAGGRFTLHLRGREGTPFTMNICQRGAVAVALRTAMRATLDLRVSRRTGGLVIRRPAGTPVSGLALVRPDGTAAGLTALIGLGCASADADGIRIPALETGTWKLIQVGSSADLMTLVTGGGFSLPGGTIVQIAAGKVSTVQIDAASGDGGSS